MGFMTAKDFNIQREDIIQISTGSKELDKILDGMNRMSSLTLFNIY